MSRTWIFQANPSLYDIDAALASLDQIWWRVPQYTGEVNVGDEVILWRSGDEAGIVGLGRVLEAPQEHPIPDEELPFVIGDSEADHGTTRARIAVAAAPFVSRDRLRALPALANHRIITAPMGTVFPLEAAERSALATLLPQPPPGPAVAESDLPPAFAWEQRAKGVMPMPGGYDGYLDAVRQVCTLVDETRLTSAELRARMASTFNLAATASRLRETFLRKAGIIAHDSGICTVGEWTRRWLEEDDPAILIALLHSRCRFIGEMLAELQTPHSTEELLLVVNERYGLEWTAYTQIDNRRGWLQSAGFISVDDDRNLVVTAEGEHLLQRLSLHDPAQVAAEGPTHPSDAGAGPEAECQALTTSNDTEGEQLAAELEAAATDSGDPDRFERAVRDAFAFLGFRAQWLGGAGKTDVLLDAPLGRDDSFRVTVDAKTSASGQVGDHAVDWVTLSEHRTQHEADYTMLVAPRPSPGRLMERAEQQGVAVLSATQLAGICIQHASSPLTLADYRGMFEQSGQVVTAAIDEAAEEANRLVLLAVALCEALGQRSPTIGRLTARDLWLILSDQEAGEATDEPEIQSLLETMASPLVRMIEGNPEDGYLVASGPGVTRRRLEVLGQALESTSGDRQES